MLLATAYQAGSQAEKAVPELDLAARLAPRNISIHECLASLYESLGMAEEAAAQQAAVTRLRSKETLKGQHG